MKPGKKEGLGFSVPEDSGLSSYVVAEGLLLYKTSLGVFVSTGPFHH